MRAQRWGQTGKGKTRFKCLKCSLTFTLGTKERYSKRHLFDAFKDWVLETLTLSFVSRNDHVGLKTLSRRFTPFLLNTPQPHEYFLSLKDKLATEGQILGGHLLLDGDWFHHERCVIVYKDWETRKILLWRFADGEFKEDIASDINFLTTHGYPLKGVTSDWHGGAVAAVASLKRSNLPHQRCLVHTQKFAEIFLTKHPETVAGEELLEIIYQLNSIKLPSEEGTWIAWLKRWGMRHEKMLLERSSGDGGRRWWYTHGSLRRVYYSLIHTLDHLFLYLKYPPLPKDTNCVEGFFSQLDSKLGRHRGQTQERKEMFISWYLFLREFPKVGVQEVQKPTHNVH